MNQIKLKQTIREKIIHLATLKNQLPNQLNLERGSENCRKEIKGTVNWDGNISKTSEILGQDIILKTEDQKICLNFQEDATVKISYKIITFNFQVEVDLFH